MSLSYTAYLDLGSDQDQPDASTLVALSSFQLIEQYSAGWQGRGVLSATSEDPLSVANMMGRAIVSGIVPGQAAVLRLVLRGVSEGDEDVAVRSWPVVVGDVEPFEAPKPTVGLCSVELLDPITFLGDRDIWGSYRGCSAAEMIGGVLSMAAGGDGKPTMELAMPDLPPVKIAGNYRDALKLLPYSIAVGQTLKEWLGDFLGLLGLRVEMLGTADGSVLVNVTDAEPSGATSVHMSITGDATARDGRLNINGLSAHAGAPYRNALLDDPTQGRFRYLSQGAVSAVLSGTDIGIDEAAERWIAPIIGTYSEMFVIDSLSEQPGLRPGRLVTLDQTFRGSDTWQVAQVVHAKTGTRYANNAKLLTSDAPWHPPLPRRRPPVIVPGVVDAGTDFAYEQPVPRDHLGRIPIRFPFTPTPIGEEFAMLQAADVDHDRRLTSADESDAEATPEEIEALRAGEYDDPYPGVPDEDLTEEQLEEREALKQTRERILKHMANQRIQAHTAADRDRDGYVTSRDELVSDELKAALADPDRRAELVAQHQSYLAGTLDTDYPNASLELIENYDQVFGSDDDADAVRARKEAELAAERWPPRLPLSVIQPFAGRLHGFVGGHRQGDACRVAIHDPLWAEVVGFQYRDDRPLNTDIKGATAGLVVEHDTGKSWSGVVFRRTEDDEENGD